MTPVRSGLALAITVGAFYALCTVAWALAPASFLSLMNNLFHGIDFTPLFKPQAFAFLGFLAALVVLSIWAFLTGMFFTWLHNRLTH